MRAATWMALTGIGAFVVAVGVVLIAVSVADFVVRLVAGRRHH